MTRFQPVLKFIFVALLCCRQDCTDESTGWPKYCKPLWNRWYSYISLPM